MPKHYNKNFSNYTSTMIVLSALQALSAETKAISKTYYRHPASLMIDTRTTSEPRFNTHKTGLPILK